MGKFWTFVENFNQNHAILSHFLFVKKHFSDTFIFCFCKVGYESPYIASKEFGERQPFFVVASLNWLKNACIHVAQEYSIYFQV